MIASAATSNQFWEGRTLQKGQFIATGVVRAPADEAQRARTLPVELASIPLPPKTTKIISWPRGLTLFYAKGGQAAFAEVLRNLAQRNEFPVPLDVTVDVGTIFSGNLNLADLPRAGLVRSNYLSNQVENILIGHWRRWLLEEGVGERDLQMRNWRNQNYIAERPDLISRLKETPEFGHIKAFSWVGAYGAVTKAGFCAVLDLSAVIKAEAGWRWGGAAVTLPEKVGVQP